MIVTGTLLDKAVNVDIKKSPKSGGGSYKGFRIAFRNEQGEVKEIAKHMNVLKYNPSIAQALDTINTNDEITVVMEKEGDFWELKSLTKGKLDLPDEAPASAPVPSTKTQSTTTKVVSTYETAEERKVKQRLIVRQAALNQAISVANGFGPEIVDSTESVLQLAEEFESWVYRGLE